MPTGSDDTMQLIGKLSAGDRSAAQQLLPLIEDELRRVARQRLRQERKPHTLQTTALVDDAFMRLVGQRDVKWQNRAHFYAMASQAIRRILVDHARRRRSAKRGGDWQRVELTDVELISASGDVDLIALDEALSRLGSLDERQARVVELRFFAGMGVRETAEVLAVSPRTVDADWHMARAWLRREMM